MLDRHHLQLLMAFVIQEGNHIYLLQRSAQSIWIRTEDLYDSVPVSSIDDPKLTKRLSPQPMSSNQDLPDESSIGLAMTAEATCQ